MKPPEAIAQGVDHLCVALWRASSISLSVSGHSFVRHPATHEAQTRFLYSPDLLPVGGRFKAMAGPVQTHTAGATTYEIRPYQVL